MVVVAVVIGGMIVMMIVMGLRRVGVGTMRIIVMLDGVAARVARMGPIDRDEASENSAQQRQENDCLDHMWVSPSSD